MPGLREILEEAQSKRIAVGHFNIADFVMLKGVFASAQEVRVPVIVGVSEGERKFLGVRQIATLVRGLREEFDFPIFLNAARIAQIKEATGVLITLHGASGTDEDDLRNAIAAGINVVHINTELRIAWR